MKHSSGRQTLDEKSTLVGNIYATVMKASDFDPYHFRYDAVFYYAQLLSIENPRIT